MPNAAVPVCQHAARERGAYSNAARMSMARTMRSEWTSRNAGPEADSAAWIL